MDIYVEIIRICNTISEIYVLLFLCFWGILHVTNHFFRLRYIHRSNIAGKYNAQVPPRGGSLNDQDMYILYFWTWIWSFKRLVLNIFIWFILICRLKVFLHSQNIKIYIWVYHYIRSTWIFFWNFTTMKIYSQVIDLYQVPA